MRLRGLAGVSPRGRLAFAAGLVATLVSLLMQWPGVVLSPDGWAYWEGSVSLLRGEGYRYLGGPPITAWPPGFSAYLAVWQALLGVSAGTLAVAHAAAIGIAAGLWVAFAGRHAPRPTVGRGEVAVAVVLALMLPIGLRGILSESLFMLWLGAALLVAGGREGGVAPRPALSNRIGRSLLFGVVATALLLTRHVGFAFLPALAWLFWRAEPATSRPARTAMLAATAGALAIWLAFRVGLGLLGSNPHVPFDADLPRRAAENLAANLGAILATLLPASPGALAVAALLAVALAFVPGFAGAGRRQVAAAQARRTTGDLSSPIALAAACAAAAWVTFDVSGPRIVLAVCALVVVLLGQWAAGAKRRSVRRLATALVLALALVQLGRGAYWLSYARQGRAEGVAWESELSRPCPPGSVCPPEPGKIAPPDFPWIERSAR